MDKTEDKTDNGRLDLHDYEKYRPPIRPKTPLESFKYAVDGILDVFRTQKHMRFHFVAVIVVLLSGLMMQLDKRDMLILIFVISLVLIAEMFNTAIEAVVDMVTQTYHPLAKFAKDAAAGAVLIATTAAVLIAFLLYPFSDSSGGFGDGHPQDPIWILKATIAGLVLLVLVVIIKALSSKGKLLRGGIISGHSTAGFFLAATILLISKNAFTAILAVLMALLIAQSRVQAKIHTIQEVAVGALVAMFLTAFVYWVVPDYWVVVFNWIHKVLHLGLIGY